MVRRAAEGKEGRNPVAVTTDPVPDSGIAGYFKFAERGTDIQTEAKAGLTTFLVMAYIIFVNPSILAAAGIDPAPAAAATALVAGVLTIAMGLVGNVPIAMAAGLGPARRVRQDRRAPGRRHPQSRPPVQQRRRQARVRPGHGRLHLPVEDAEGVRRLREAEPRQGLVRLIQRIAGYIAAGDPLHYGPRDGWHRVRYGFVHYSHV